MEDLGEDTKGKIEQLQLLEQNLNAFIGQKQQFQSQLMEVESALKELEKTDQAYKIIGNVMVAVERTELEKDLTSKKDIIGLRIKAIEKQEKNIREKASVIQKDVLKDMK